MWRTKQENGITYSGLGNEIEKTASLLDILGITKGDKVALIGENMPGWGIAFLSILGVGAVAVPILPDFHENEVQNIIEHSESKMLIASSRQISRLKNIISGKMPVIITDTLTPLGAEAEEPTGIPIRFTLESMDKESVEDNLATIIYTSGTTGSSKGVMLTHKNLAWMAKQCLTVQHVEAGDRFLSILPMSHTYENSIGFLLPLLFCALQHPFL